MNGEAPKVPGMQRADGFPSSPDCDNDLRMISVYMYEVEVQVGKKGAGGFPSSPERNDLRMFSLYMYKVQE